ncbi:OPT oligopeptide transporter protein-domain-containing protein [Lentinula aff. lateritia]|uniref:OPT oligopeptide transporter protein-domain-containing protein n=1 Tax=Lentinula aff. lateritia TaxID=2804960 RepID=A0ACC1TV99_9AGAR|nr:OPT oligopeptide transporter protein-domain-containing protein [Lentinula aff. lateritia]
MIPSSLRHWIQEHKIKWLPSSRDSALVEFSLPAIIIGLLIGCLLCFTNLYFGLQTGFISMMSLQSALIGFLVSKMLPTPLTPQEIILVQTTATATGTMPLAAGFVGIIPALGLIDEERDGSPPIHLTWVAGIGWSCAVAFFGVFLSPPIRKQVIIEEELAFPSGTATAQLISVLHKLPPPNTSLRRRNGYQSVEDQESDEETDVRPVRETTPLRHPETTPTAGWHELLWSFVASSLLTLAAYFFPVIFAIPLFGNYLAREWAWSFTPSLSYVGQGIIMGFPTTLSMNMGMLVGWGILSPIAKFSGWAPGPVGDMTSGSRGWILWVSLAIMCADSLVSLLPVAWEFLVDTVRRMKHGSSLQLEGKNDGEIESADRLVPGRWVIIGWCVSVLVGIALVWIVFGHEGIKPAATFAGYVIGGLLSVLAVRALGETDINPVSGLGKISQLFFAWIQPGNIVANIIAGGVAEAGAQQAGDLMQDLKTGHLCGASPRAQFYGQLIGSVVSIFVTTTAYSLYTRVYPIPGPSFPAPTAYVWLSFARLLRDGQLPEKSDVFMVGFAIIFALIAAVKFYAANKQVWWAKWVPSGVAFAIGFLNTPSFSIARFIGGILEYIFRTRYARNGGDIRLIVIASGFVLGEGVTSVISLILKTCGVGVASCWGCGQSGVCGGCSV